MNCEELRTEAILMLRLCLLRLKLLPELRRLVCRYTRFVDSIEWAPRLTVISEEDIMLAVEVRLEDGWYDPVASRDAPSAALFAALGRRAMQHAPELETFLRKSETPPQQLSTLYIRSADIDKIRRRARQKISVK